MFPAEGGELGSPAITAGGMDERFGRIKKTLPTGESSADMLEIELEANRNARFKLSLSVPSPLRHVVTMKVAILAGSVSVDSNI